MDQQTIRAQRRAIAAGIAGNVMEWYDFSVYGYFAAIIGRNFFPTGDRTTSLIAAFGVFAAGLFVRPLGSILFGYRMCRGLESGRGDEIHQGAVPMRSRGSAGAIGAAE
jgi:MFS family permease